MAGGEGDREGLEFTPTWVVAGVCSLIVVISLDLERILHFLRKYLKKKNQKPLFEALQKVKEELMVLGFISLLLTVFQGALSRICIPEHLTRKFLPCEKETEISEVETSAHFQTFLFSGILGTGRRLLAEESSKCLCAKKVLDSPSLQDDFYLNLVDWSSQNVLAVGLGACVYLWTATNSKERRKDSYDWNRST